MARSPRHHVHCENASRRNPLFHVTPADWRAAARRHPELAQRVRVTFGRDGDILDDALRTAEIVIAAAPPRERLAERAPRLRWIQTTGAGVDALMPLDWLPPGAVLTNNAGSHGAKAEDSVLMALTMLNARMPIFMAAQQARVWRPVYTTPAAGKTVVVVGFGALGRGAARAAKKLGMTVIAVTRSGRAGRPADAAVTTSRLAGALRKADFVVVATPLTAETHHLFDRKRLDALKPHAALVNISRAGVVDYEALREKLELGELAGALLDVFDPEPLPPSSPLWTTPGLIITPHVTCDDPRYIALLLDRWFANLERWLTGRRLRNVVDGRLGYSPRTRT